jgi:hypothetical protein
MKKAQRGAGLSGCAVGLTGDEFANHEDQPHDASTRHWKAGELQGLCQDLARYDGTDQHDKRDKRRPIEKVNRAVARIKTRPPLEKEAFGGLEENTGNPYQQSRDIDIAAIRRCAPP